MINERDKSIRSSADFGDLAGLPDADSAEQMRLFIRKLNRIGSMLSYWGLTILTCTLLNIGVSVLLIARLSIYMSGSNMILLSVLSTGLAILAAVTYAIGRREGDAIFEEVSDELQWRIQRKINVPQEIDVFDEAASKHAAERPELNERVALRTYARTSELLFIPGKYGAVSYVLLNLALVIFNSIYLR